MNWRNSDTKYGLLASGLHWIMAVLVIGVLAIGLLLEEFEDAPQALRIQVYSFHKSLGVTVLLLVTVRAVWRQISKPPAPLATHKDWEKKLAKATHYALYFCMFAMPLSGWVMSSAKGYSVSFFGLFTLPDFVPKDKGLSETAKEIHEIVSNVLIGVIVLHVAGALKHHFVDRDGTLRRMLPFSLLLATLVPAFLMTASPSARGYEPLLTTWAIVKDQSHLTFEGTQGGAHFTGEFKSFDGTITFMLDNLASSHAMILVDTASAVTGNDDRDNAIGGKEWFASAAFPQAKFDTTGFEKADENGSYLAHATLTIRDVTLPVDLPFTLSIDGDTATMHGELTVNRLDFGVGQGEWKDTKAVGSTIKVAVSLVAQKQS